ncbi:MAG: hypothetical protein KDB01_01555 [Planctomycetaceae bacterium]|nr:hypothetical protein [Planctomycetaceae bacterium]
MKSTIMVNIAGPMFGLSLLLLGIGILAATKVQQQQRVNADLITREVNALLAVEELYIVVRDIRHELNLYLRTREPRSLDNIAGYIRSAKEPMELAKQLARTKTESQLISNVESGYQDFLTRFNEIVSDETHAERDQSLAELNDQFLESRIFAPIRRCIGHNRDIVERTIQAGTSTANQMRIGFLLLGITGSIAGLVFGLGIARAITRSFVQLDVSVRSVSGKLKGISPPVQISHIGDLQGLDFNIRQLEGEIGEVVERLQRRELEVLRGEQLAVVGQLAAGVAHELRNPLMPVKVLVQSAIEKGDAGALRGAELQIVNDEIQRLEKSIQAFLDFARPPVLESVRAEIQEIIRRAVDLIATHAIRKQVTLELEMPQQPVFCLVDGPQLRQVLLNLFLNSFDAMQQGGRIHVRLSEINEPWAETVSLQDALRIRNSAHTDSIEITVTDSGPGFAQDMLAHVFEPFVTTKETGTGLGLSICERIITAHGGTILARNASTGGAEFVIRIPHRI